MPRRALALALLTLAFTALFLPRVAGAQSASAAEGSFAELIAQERMKAGLASYRGATDLADVARAHAERMATEGRLYHNPNLREQVQNWDVVGENVGKGVTVADIHQAFMESDTHRREILSPRLTEVGVGVVQRNGLIWVSQVFRRPTPAPATTTTAPPSSRAAGAPKRSPTHPTSGAPSGVPPRKHMKYSAMTRPRICGSTPSWTKLLFATLKASAAAPVGTSNAAKVA